MAGGVPQGSTAACLHFAERAPLSATRRADGGKYEGEWQNGFQNGRGRYTWPDGERPHFRSRRTATRPVPFRVNPHVCCRLALLVIDRNSRPDPRPQGASTKGSFGSDTGREKGSLPVRTERNSGEGYGRTERSWCAGGALVPAPFGVWSLGAALCFPFHENAPWFVSTERGEAHRCAEQVNRPPAS